MKKININGWSLDIEGIDDPLSMVFQNITHEGYNFAKEIRFNKIIIELENPVNKLDIQIQELIPADFEKNEVVEFFITDALEINNFPYPMDGKLFKCKTKDNILLFEKTDSLYLWYGFAVGIKDNDPPHEFTGALQAARFMPVFRFATTNKAIKSIRVDYKFHFDVDSYLKTDNMVKQPFEKPKDQINNYCSILQDADHFPPSLTAFVGIMNDIKKLLKSIIEFNSYFIECNKNYSLGQVFPSLTIYYKRGADEIGISIERVPGRGISIIEGTKDPFIYNLNKVEVKLLNTITNSEQNIESLQSLIINKIETLKNPTQIDKAFMEWYIFDDGSNKLNFKKDLNCKLSKIVFKNYFHQKLVSIIKHYDVLKKNVGSDAQDILPYLKLEELVSYFFNIEKVIESIIAKAFANSIFEKDKVTLKKLYDDFISFNGKVMSIISFTSAEKPVLYEMVGSFVKNTAGYDRNTWDNLHWWGTDEIPSAPGAFHAIHSHFHWADFLSFPKAGEGDVINFLDETLGNKKKNVGTDNIGLAQWRSAITFFKEQGLAGPLIDPKIPLQQIQFAITKTNSELYERISKSSGTLSFEDIALSLDKMASDKTITDKEIKSKPKKIATIESNKNTGEDIVFWLSCKAEKTIDYFGRFQGIFFVNGFYFAHDEELPFSFFKSTSPFAATRGVDLQKPDRGADYKIFREPEPK